MSAEINCSYLFHLKLTLGLSVALLSWSLSSPCILSGLLLICSPSEMDKCLIKLQWLPLIISIKATLLIAGTRHPSPIWHSGPCPETRVTLFPLSAALFSSLFLFTPQDHPSSCVFCATSAFSDLSPNCIFENNS